MSGRASLVWKLAVPILCLVAGGAVGYRIGGVRAGRGGAALRELREGGYRYVNPLVECEAGKELIQSEELRPFRSRVASWLQGELRFPGVKSVSVYFRELNDGIWFVIGEREVYTPASLRKVPMMIAVLKQAERAPDLLARTVPFRLQRDYGADQTFKPSVAMVPGREYAVGELVRRMIVSSDNNAFMLLAGIVDPGEIDRVYDLMELRGPEATAEGEFRSVLTYASFFRILYNASYLGKELSEHALGLLAQSEFRRGIVEGVPAGMPVAHKFGEHRDDASGEAQLHDCGIVYFPRHPYLLCVMTRGTSFDHLDDAIAATSRIIHHEVAAQFRAAP
jgi:beta-lactamase class A